MALAWRSPVNPTTNGLGETFSRWATAELVRPFAQARMMRARWTRPYGILITYEPHVPGSTPAREPDSGQ